VLRLTPLTTKRACPCCCFLLLYIALAAARRLLRLPVRLLLLLLRLLLRPAVQAAGWACARRTRPRPPPCGRQHAGRPAPAAPAATPAVCHWPAQAAQVHACRSEAPGIRVRLRALSASARNRSPRVPRPQPRRLTVQPRIPAVAGGWQTRCACGGWGKAGSAWHHARAPQTWRTGGQQVCVRAQRHAVTHVQRATCAPSARQQLCQFPAATTRRRLRTRSHADVLPR
jgi:hypothetical protein